MHYTECCSGATLRRKGLTKKDGDSSCFLLKCAQLLKIKHVFITVIFFVSFVSFYLKIKKSAGKTIKK
jgi:hypothetical protein